MRKVNAMKMARFFQGISQEELARRIGADQPFVSNLELGRLKLTPRVIRLRKEVALILGTSVEALFPEQES